MPEPRAIPSESAPSDRGLAGLLRREPCRFDFFQGVRVPSLVFPASSIYEIHDPPAGEGPVEMTVAFFGLTGPSGALPRIYTELLLERIRSKDKTLRDFLDLFNHRLISLFYRSWEKYRFWFAFERAERLGRGPYAEPPDRWRSFVMEGRSRIDRFSQCLLDLAGFGPGVLRYRAMVRQQLEPRSAVGDSTLRYFSGLLAQQHRSGVGLEGLLGEYFGLPLAIEQCVGQWLQIEADDQSALSEDRDVSLGAAVLGQRYWDVQGKFRLRLGPLTFDQFQRFLPTGDAHRALSDLVRLYAGPHLDADVQLILQAPEVPWFQLNDDPLGGPRLGWNTWVRSGEFTRHAEDAILTLA
jgi:type VI secretion system protein ImpH